MTDEKITNNMDNRFYKLISQFDESAIKEVTPKWVVDDMLDLLPDEVWCRNTRFLDIYSKSGVFLYCIMEHLMTKAYDLIEEFPDEDARKAYIVENQLFGLSWTNIKFADTTRAIVNRKASRTHHMAFIEGDYKVYLKGNGKLLNDELQRIKTEEFDNNMKFDVVVGNPPYNNDMYLDFVQLGYQLSSKYTCMITPAKWQAKGGEKNEEFRKNIVPHMSKIVYYPDTGDIFDIHLLGGTCYYLIPREYDGEAYIKNICTLNEQLCGDANRVLQGNMCLYNSAISIYNKMIVSNNIFSKYAFSNKKYKCNICHMVNTNAGSSTSHTFNNNGMLLGTSTITVEENMRGSNYYVMFSSDNIDEAKSFKSYIDTRLIRFLVFISTIASSLKNEETWRFIPDPGAFDHIFTDEELYKKYNLIDEEITIIESVIKERK